MTNPNVPSAPSYTDILGQGGGGSSTKPPAGMIDVFDLGDLYGAPVGLGTYQAETVDPKLKKFLPRGDKDDKPESVQMGTGYDLLNNFANLAARANAGTSEENLSAMQQVVDIQRALYDARFYGAKKFDAIGWGAAGSDTISALKDALSAYEQAISPKRMAGNPDQPYQSQTPLTFAEFLRGQSQGYALTGATPGTDPSGSGGGGTKGAQLYDPATLKGLAQQSAMKALGHGLSDDQLNSFVSQFHQAQMETYANSQTGNSFTATDPQAQADQFVTGGQFADEHQNHQVMSAAQILLNDMLSGASTLPAPSSAEFNDAQTMGS